MTVIPLSRPTRNVLLSMQTNAAQQAEAQSRMASGLKVRSMLDNPTSFSAARSLNARASDLTGLMDGMRNALGSLEAADHAVTATRALISQMRNIVQDEIKDPSTVAEDFKTTVFGSSGWSPGDNLGASNGNNFNITVADTTDNSTFSRVQFRYGAGNDGTTMQDLIDTVSASPLVTASLDAGRLRFDSTDGRAFFITQSTNFVAITGFQRGAYWSGDELTERVVTGWKAGMTTATTMGSIGAGSGTRTFQSRDSNGNLYGATVTYNGSTTVQQVMDQINADADFGFTAELSADGRFRFRSKPGQDVMSFHMPSNGSLHGGLGVVDGSGGGRMPTLSLSEKKVVSQRFAPFDELRNQVNDIVADSELSARVTAGGEPLDVLINERGTKLGFSPSSITTASLGLAGIEKIDFSDPASLDAVLDKLDAAEARLEAESVSLAAQRGVLQTRIGFTETMTGLLTDGASNLVLADVNEEAANMLAIDTRNQLAASALAFVTQSDRGALNLVNRGLERLG